MIKLILATALLATASAQYSSPSRVSDVVDLEGAVGLIRNMEDFLPAVTTISKLAQSKLPSFMNWASKQLPGLVELTKESTDGLAKLLQVPPQVRATMSPTQQQSLDSLTPIVAICQQLADVHLPRLVDVATDMMPLITELSQRTTDSLPAMLNLAMAATDKLEKDSKKPAAPVAVAAVPTVAVAAPQPVAQPIANTYVAYPQATRQQLQYSTYWG